MRTLSKIIMVVMFATTLAESQAATIYQNNFDAGAASLSGFTPFGTASVQVSNGALSVGVSGFDRGGVALNTASLAGYSDTLSSNVGLLTWAFNVANVDGAYNNMFNIVFASNSSDPFDFGLPAKGYSLSGGGYVGNRMLLSRFDHGLNTYQILIDVPDESGLATVPQNGAVRVTYDPTSDTWSLYMDTGSNPTDPTAASQLLGTAVDGTYTHTPLPFFTFGGETSGTEFYDNFSISIVPEPSTLCLTALGILAFCRQARGVQKS